MNLYLSVMLRNFNGGWSPWSFVSLKECMEFNGPCDWRLLILSYGIILLVFTSISDFCS